MASVKQKKLTKEQIRKFKMTERKLHSRFSNSSEEELGKIKNKIIKTLMLEIMSWLLLLSFLWVKNKEVKEK